MLFLVWCMLALPSDAQAVHGHAHNDYTHDRPLFSALEHGLSSIEIDVHAHDGRLVVSHGSMRLRRKPGIRDLYLRPVDSLIEAGSDLLPGHLVLMIDLKSPTSEALPLLLHAIRPLHDHLSFAIDGDVHHRDLSILVSGHGFSADDIDLEDTVRIFLDGRPTGSCAQRGLPAELIPRISARYGDLFAWNGRGEMPETDRAALDRLLQLHAPCGQRLRFWAMPEDEMLWTTFSQAGVAWLNIDDHDRFHSFLSPTETDQP